MSERDIEIGVVDEIQVIRFTRPDKKNAFTGRMYDAMSEALDRGDKDDGIIAHVFIGSGGIFNAGNDINDFIRRSKAGTGEGIPTPSLSFIRRLPKVTKPMIAAVDGLAIGIGTTMLFHCDLVYASPTASLRTPFLDLGLVPEAASSLTAVMRMGNVRAFELLCLGETFDAEAGIRAGLINRVVPVERLEAEALAAAGRLAAKPRRALIAAKRLMRRGVSEAATERMKLENEAFASLLGSSEAREAFAAFLEKRAPDFSAARRRDEN